MIYTKNGRLGGPYQSRINHAYQYDTSFVVPIHYVIENGKVIYPEPSEYLPYKVSFTTSGTRSWRNGNSQPMDTEETIILTSFPCYVKQYTGPQLTALNPKLDKLGDDEDGWFSPKSKYNDLQSIWIVCMPCTRAAIEGQLTRGESLVGLDTAIVRKTNGVENEYIESFSTANYSYYFDRYNYDNNEIFRQTNFRNPVMETMFPGKSFKRIMLTVHGHLSTPTLCPIFLPDASAMAYTICHLNKWQMMPKFFNGVLDCFERDGFGDTYHQMEDMTTTVNYNNNPYYAAYQDWYEDITSCARRAPAPPTIRI